MSTLEQSQARLDAWLAVYDSEARKDRLDDAVSDLLATLPNVTPDQGADVNAALDDVFYAADDLRGLA